MSCRLSPYKKAVEMFRLRNEWTMDGHISWVDAKEESYFATSLPSFV